MREDIDKQIVDEETQYQGKEKEVLQMEMLEMELIKNLQNTQAIQKQAYSDLENVLQKPTKYLDQHEKKKI